MKKFELKDSKGITYAFVSKEDDKPWVYIQWIGTVKAAELIQAMSEAQGIFAPFILSDRRLSDGNLFDVIKYIENKWGPHAVQAGLRCVANVSGSSSFSQFGEREMASRILGFEFKSFDTLEEAETWLMERAAHVSH